MAVGKKTGGRSKGTPGKAMARREKEIAKGGDTLLDYMLKVMRKPKADASRRDDMAEPRRPRCIPSSQSCSTQAAMAARSRQSTWRN